MDIFLEARIGVGVAILLAGSSIVALGLCICRLRMAYRLAGQYACAIWLVRGIRCLIIALTAAAWAAGFYWQQGWLLIIGLVILAQELYEGFVLSSALRDGLRIENGGLPKGML
jgi:hypothetical protein